MDPRILISVKQIKIRNNMDDLVKVSLKFNLGLLYQVVENQFGCGAKSDCANKKVMEIVNEYLENYLEVKEEKIQYKTIGTRHISVFLEFTPPERNLGEHPILVGSDVIPCTISVEN